MKRFEELYRIREADDVLAKEDAIHSDLDRRLDAVEQDAQAFRDGNRADVDAILTNLSSTFSRVAGQVQDLLDATADNLSADTIIESVARRFLTDDRQADILSTADTAATTHTDAVAAYILALLINGAPAGRDNFKALSDLIATEAADLTGALNRIAAEEAKSTALSSTINDGLGKRLRVDGAQTLDVNQKSQALGNLGIATFLKTFLGAADGAGARNAIGAQDSIISALMRGFVNQTDTRAACGVIQAVPQLRGGNVAYLGWDGQQLDAQVDSTYMGRVWTARAVIYSAAGNGYIRFPNGFTIQWGVTTGAGDYNINFPTSFSYLIGVFSQPLARNTGGVYTGQIDNQTSGGFSFAVRYLNTAGVQSPNQSAFWIAIGHINVP